jgi:molybdenum cofactor guanylyltransferase
MTPTFSAVILAGGASRRMGRNKAWLEVHGLPLIVRQIGLARELGAAEVLISGPTGQGYEALGGQLVEDVFRNHGPLAGLERVLALASSSQVLALAVDMPHMTAVCLRRLLQHCGADVGAVPFTTRLEPLAAFYPVRSRRMLLELMGDGPTPATRFAELCVEMQLASVVQVPPALHRCFDNWNSPGDFTRTAKLSQAICSR